MSKPIRLIFEGPDGAGKSTLIKRLEKQLGRCMTIHFTKPQCNTPEENLRFVKLNRENLEYFIPMAMFNHHLLYDRSCLSSEVYGPLFDGFEYDSEEYQKQMIRYGFKVIFVMADPSVLKKRIMQQGDWNENTNYIEKIFDRYFDLITKCKIPNMVYWTDLDTYPSMSKIIEQDQRLEEFIGLKTR